GCRPRALPGLGRFTVGAAHGDRADLRGAASGDLLRFSALHGRRLDCRRGEELMATVHFREIVKNYGKTRVVHGISLDIADGEFVVLVGPSGCGKSTLLRSIAGLETINGGEIHIGERQVNHVAPKDRDIAMVFQSYALYPHMDVRKNMAFSLNLRKSPAQMINERVSAASTKLGLNALLERLPKQLSGGQRQRVAMGRAIVRNPKVFLFDEPLSNLDAKL